MLPSTRDTTPFDDLPHDAAMNPRMHKTTKIVTTNSALCKLACVEFDQIADFFAHADKKYGQAVFFHDADYRAAMRAASSARGHGHSSIGCTLGIRSTIALITARSLPMFSLNTFTTCPWVTGVISGCPFRPAS